MNASSYVNLENQKPFSQSIIWDWHTHYYQVSGVNAWSGNNIPHFITNSPVIAKSYAEMIFAFLQDLNRINPSLEKVYLLELGAGHGKLCYHFRKHFDKLADKSEGRLPKLCYVLSDFVDKNLDFWKKHPRLQPYIEAGEVEVAKIDATQELSEIKLECSNQVIKRGSLDAPLIALANYFFDSIPADLFYIKNKELYRCLVRLDIEGKYRDAPKEELLKKVKITYQKKRLPGNPYSETFLSGLISEYTQSLPDTYLLFPHIGIKRLHNLRKLSNKGMLLLTADKGYHREESLILPTHNLEGHGGCFSLPVNYHSFKRYCINEQGEALFPNRIQFHLQIGCLFFLHDHRVYSETHLAYERFINDFGPDDRFTIKMALRNLSGLSLQQIISILCLNGFDTDSFRDYLPEIFKRILDEISEDERWSLFQIAHKTWDNYFPLGEDYNPAFDIAELLFKLDFFKEAIVYLKLSTQIFGETTQTLYNLALSHFQLKEDDQALVYVLKILKIDPDYEPAKILAEDLQKK